jgi:hypothetical protein
MDNIANDWISEIIVFIIVVVIVLIILAAMGKFDTFSNRVVKRFTIKKRGRIYSEKVINNKHNN